MSGIRDITWEMGTPMPYPTKGQAQGVIGDPIVAAAGVGHVGWDRSDSDGWDFSKGVYRLGSEVGLIGDKTYMCGGEVVSNCNVTDEVVVGTIIEG